MSGAKKARTASTATAQPGHRSPVRAAAAALLVKPLPFCSSPAGWRGRPPKDISHASHQVQPQPVLCAGDPKWGQLRIATAVPEEASAAGFTLLSEHMQSKYMKSKARFPGFQITVGATLPLYSTILHSFPREERTKTPADQNEREAQGETPRADGGWSPRGDTPCDTSEGLAESTGQGWSQHPPPLQRVGGECLGEDLSQGTRVGAEWGRFPVPGL